MREELSTDIDMCDHGNERGSCPVCNKPKTPREVMKKCPHGRFYRDCTICKAIADTESSIVEEEARTGRSLTGSKKRGEGTTPEELGVPSPQGEELTPPSEKSKEK